MENIEDKEKHIQTFGYSKFSKEASKIGFDAVPAISAHVNGYARVHMWKLMEKAGFENVHYIDNDGIKVNEQGYRNLMECIDDKQLGMLKFEYTGYLTAYVAKDYKVREAKDRNGKPVSQNNDGIEGLIIKMKGISLKSEKIESLIGKEVYSQDKFQGPYDIMMKGKLDGFQTTKINIKRNLQLHGREVLEGGDTKPLTLATDITKFNELNKEIDAKKGTGGSGINPSENSDNLKPKISTDFRVRD